MMKLLTLLAFTGLFSYSAHTQQLRIPSPSPTETIRQEFGLSTIELSYSRPGIKGRKIFGDLVPYGKVWRTGANQATTITFGDDVTIGDVKVPAGKYGLLTVPGPDEWSIIITRQLDVTNPAAYKIDQDVIRVKVRAQEFPFPIESFSMLFSNITPTSCDLALFWDKTLVALPIKTDIDTRIMAQIDKAQGRDSFPYFTAAFYYLENKKDLNKAEEWFTKAAQQNPNGFFIYYQKARCEAKLGRKKDAIATAQKSIELAKQAKNDDYVALNEKLIASLQ
jgi:Protein of unknown function (DUF2911)/Tetratricopeptide repeat